MGRARRPLPQGVAADGREQPGRAGQGGQGWGPAFPGRRTARAQPGTLRLPLNNHHVDVCQTRSAGFPGGPVVRTSPSSVGGVGSILGWGAKIPHVLGSKKQKQYGNKLNKDF